MLKKVRIAIQSDSKEVNGTFCETPMEHDISTAEGVPAGEEAEHIELLMEGRYRDDGERISVTYDETDDTGMKGSATTVFYQKNNPNFVSMLRTGSVRTSLLFEKGERHLCVYETSVMPLEVSVHTVDIQNHMETTGNLTLDYIVEIRGTHAEKTHFSMTVLPYYEKPKGLSADFDGKN